MRPLSKPALPLQAAALHSPHALLMNALGHFCAFCERPLLAESWVWNARTGDILAEAPADPADWDDLYLLDHNCFEAQRNSTISDLSTLLLPNRPEAFNPLNPNSPIRYAMERITRVQTDEQGQPIGQPEVVDGVVMIGNTDAARATIAHFALNTAYYQADEKRLVIPRTDYLSLADRRMDQRTLAWQRTEEVARRISVPAREAVSAAMIEQLRLLVGAMGFWSSCLTAAWSVLGNKGMMRRAFLEPAAPVAPVNAIMGMASHEAAAFGGCGPYHTFPGTHDIFGA